MNMDGLPKGNIAGLCRPEGARLDRKTWRFVPRCWDWLDFDAQAAVVDQLEQLTITLDHTSRPWKQLIGLTQAKLRVRATILGQSLDETEFWERHK